MRYESGLENISAVFKLLFFIFNVSCAPFNGSDLGHVREKMMMIFSRWCYSLLTIGQELLFESRGQTC